MSLYADIVIPIARGTFTFRVDEAYAADIREGMGVEVLVGARKLYMGIVWRLHEVKPSFATKTAGRIMTSRPLLTQDQMRLWDWVSDYYMCTLGDVMRFALPSALKPSGLSQEEFSQDEYRPSTIKYISLGDAVKEKEGLDALLDTLRRRSKAQYAAVMDFFSLTQDNGDADCEVPRAHLSASSAVIAKLVEKEIFVIRDRETAEIGSEKFTLSDIVMPELSIAQQRAKSEIEESFKTQTCTLLYGITGSGKTEIYISLIADALGRGESVMYLMPEIAMTSQLVARVRAVFGERVTVFHSGLTDRRRAEVYRRLLASGGGELVLGARSAVFLPVPSLGLIIADEEHDASYKQSEPAPRYNARDCAVWLARHVGAKCLLASATPSIEGYVNATGGKYGLVRLNERYGNASLPQVTVSDSLRAVKRGERKIHFDKALTDSMREVLGRGKQVMLFQNRRGFAPWVECEGCSWVAHCPRCSVTLTYHKNGNRLLCHTCGYSTAMPVLCPKCGTPKPKLMGFGTEKVEQEINSLFPEARILRLDRDTATSPLRYEKIVADFGCGAADILVGTQMITKGFDFPGVELVGILNADNLLNYPDFRAAERAYQVMTQFSGRAGRAGNGGEVVIQTTQPDNPVICQVQTLDYEGMVNIQLAERSVFGYPPYGKLIVVTLRHRDDILLARAAEWLAARMRTHFAERVFGPHAPVVEKAAEESYMEIVLKIENGRSAAKAKTILAGVLAEAARHEEYKKIFIFCDIDPQ